MHNMLQLLLAAMVLGTRAQNQEGFWNTGSGIQADHDPNAQVHVQWTRGAYAGKMAQLQSSGGAAPLMTWHGGNILTSCNITGLFWGLRWGDSSFSGDKISGLESLYTGFSNSYYAQTSDEYIGSNGPVQSSTIYVKSLVDVSTAAQGSATSLILAKVCQHVSRDDSGNAYYAVYTDLPRGENNYCSWRSYGTCTVEGSHVLVHFAFFWSLDGDTECDPQDDGTSGNSQGLASLANASGAQLSELRTDPTSQGWFDSAGLENADKCAWTFNVPAVTLSNGQQFKLQGEWSNRIYPDGYPNSFGQRGCLDGQNFF